MLSHLDRCIHFLNGAAEYIRKTDRYLDLACRDPDVRRRVEAIPGIEHIEPEMANRLQALAKALRSPAPAMAEGE